MDGEFRNKYKSEPQKENPGMILYVKTLYVAHM